MKRFRPCNLDQPFLLPPSLDDWLPARHLARYIALTVSELDLSGLYAAYGRKDGRGKAAFHPEMMLRLLIYGYATGRRSSRQLERATYEDLACRYLSADEHPDHDTIATFRRRHLGEMEKLFVQVLRVCEKAGLVELSKVAIDGTKLSGNASRSRSRSYERLTEKEREYAHLVSELLAEAEAIDAAEEARQGSGQGSNSLPQELATAAQQLEKIRAAKQALEEEAKQRAEAAQQERAAQNNKPRDEAQKKRWQRAKKGKPDQGKKGNLTDPDSRLMKGGTSKGFVQGYNAQVAAAGQHRVIVGQTVTNEPNDRRQLGAMLGEVKKNLDRLPDVALADTGYWNEAELQEQLKAGVDVLAPPGGEGSQAGELAANAPRTPLAVAMRERLAEEEGAKLYRQRSGLVEPVFGWIKEIFGYRRFLLRGLSGVRAEWSLICTAVNLQKLFRYGKVAAATG